MSGVTSRAGERFGVLAAQPAAGLTRVRIEGDVAAEALLRGR
jgi:hypothetical protein